MILREKKRKWERKRNGEKKLCAERYFGEKMNQ
jgi:hypothetical protein